MTFTFLICAPAAWGAGVVPFQPRVTLLYDRDCGFCRWSLAWFLCWDRRHVLRPQRRSGLELGQFEQRPHAGTTCFAQDPKTGSHQSAVVTVERRNVRDGSDRDQVERMLSGLGRQEADVVRMFHLEGKSYREISQVLGIAENSIGPTLHRARHKLRRQAHQRSMAQPPLSAT